MGQNNLNSVLIVEDDHESNHNLQSLMKDKFDKVLGAYDGYEGWNMYQSYHPSIVIADIEMPKMNGLDLISKIRAVDPICFIVVLTSYSNQNYLLQAVTLKLDNYILKPINSQKLASFFSLIEKQRMKLQGHIFTIDTNTIYNANAKIVIKGDQRVLLSNSEISLLELFLESRGKLLNYETIEYTLFESEGKSRNALKILVSHLRKKVPELNIKSIPKIGYLCT